MNVNGTCGIVALFVEIDPTTFRSFSSLGILLFLRIAIRSGGPSVDPCKSECTGL
jgi:hypothetical protein